VAGAAAGAAAVAAAAARRTIEARGERCEVGRRAHARGACARLRDE